MPDLNPTTPGTPRTKVVFVEDDKFLQKILVTKFTKEGFDVVTASDAEEAMRAMEASVPNIILLDLILVGTSGFDLLALIRSHAKLKNVPVVVLTNLAQDEDRKRAMSLGANEYLVKADVSINNVVQRVREAYVRFMQGAKA